VESQRIIMEKNCIFCKIIAGQVASKAIFQNENVIVIQDIQPQAKTHLLVIPKKHIESLVHVMPEDKGLLADLMESVAIVAEKVGLAQGGFRTVINTGKNGGQTVFHLHVHLMGGQTFSEKFN
jgi:histidine triad (HIT) family protein